MKTLRILRTFSILALTSALSIGLIGFVSSLVYSFFGEIGILILALCVILFITALYIENT